MSNLSADHREILDLVYYQEKSITDCAFILGIPAATVKTACSMPARSWLSGRGGVASFRTDLTSLGVRNFEMCKGLGDAPSSPGPFALLPIGPPSRMVASYAPCSGSRGALINVARGNFATASSFFPQGHNSAGTT